jgi:hypothetical protein
MEGIIFLLFLFWVVVSMGIGAYAIDQDKSGLWGIVVFFTGIFGMVFFAISLASE